MDGGGQSDDFFTRFAKTLTGKSDSDLTPEELAARNRRRMQANQMANNAAENPGEEFMKLPDLRASGQGFGLQDIAAVIQKMFG